MSGLILCGFLSSYSHAQEGPSLNKELPVKLNQKVTLSVNWEPVDTLEPSPHPYHQGPVGKLSISSSGLSSITLKDATSPHVGKVAFHGPSGAYYVTDVSGNNNVKVTPIQSGVIFTPPPGSNVLPSDFVVSFGILAATTRLSGVYTSTITLESIVS